MQLADEDFHDICSCSQVLEASSFRPLNQRKMIREMTAGQGIATSTVEIVTWYGNYILSRLGYINTTVYTTNICKRDVRHHFSKAQRK